MHLFSSCFHYGLNMRCVPQAYVEHLLPSWGCCSGRLKHHLHMGSSWQIGSWGHIITNLEGHRPSVLLLWALCILVCWDVSKLCHIPHYHRVHHPLPCFTACCTAFLRTVSQNKSSLSWLTSCLVFGHSNEKSNTAFYLHLQPSINSLSGQLWIFDSLFNPSNLTALSQSPNSGLFQFIFQACDLVVFMCLIPQTESPAAFQLFCFSCCRSLSATPFARNPFSCARSPHNTGCVDPVLSSEVGQVPSKSL